MEIEMLTKADLAAFRAELLQEIRQLLSGGALEPQNPWLKNEEVCRLLGISVFTLKRLRIYGKVASTKIGGIYYYAYKEIEKLLFGSPNV